MEILIEEIYGKIKDCLDSSQRSVVRKLFLKVLRKFVKVVLLAKPHYY